MINRLTYLYQKFKLSILLARYDLLFLTENLISFKKVIKPAKVFVKHSKLSASERLEQFLQAYQSSIPNIIVSELAALAFAKSGVFFCRKEKEQNYTAGTSVLQKAYASTQKQFFQKLIQEIYEKDFSEYQDGLSDFQNRFDETEDMRLYAAQREDVLKFTTASSDIIPLQTDWVKTTKEEWIVDSQEAFTTTSKLNLEAGQKLAKLFAKQLFEKGFFVLGFNQVAIDSQARIAFTEVDSVHKVSDEHCLALLHNRPLPQDIISCKLKYARAQLAQICSESSVKKAFEPYVKNYQKKTIFLPQDQEVSETMNNYYAEKKEENPQSFWSRHIERKYAKANKQTNKISILYWGPALIVGIILFVLMRF